MRTQERLERTVWSLGARPRPVDVVTCVGGPDGPGPVFHDDDSRMWVCWGYPETVQVLSDERSFSSIRFGGSEPRTARLRALLDSTVRDMFSSARIIERDEALMRIAEDVVDALPDRGSVDIGHDLTDVLSRGLIRHLLPTLDLGHDVVGWARAQHQVLDPAAVTAMTHRAPAAVWADAMTAMTDHVRSRCDSDGRDMAGTLVAAAGHLDVTGPGRDAAVATILLTLIAQTHQALVDLVTGGVILLHRNPDQQRLLRDDPDLIDRTLVETARLRGSTVDLARRIDVDVVLAGRRIAAGETVFLPVAAARMDPREFPDPTAFRIARPGPDRLGALLDRHHHIGHPVARRLARWALLGFLARFPAFHMVPSARAGSACHNATVVESPHVVLESTVRTGSDRATDVTDGSAPVMVGSPCLTGTSMI